MEENLVIKSAFEDGGFIPVDLEAGADKKHCSKHWRRPCTPESCFKR